VRLPFRDRWGRWLVTLAIGVAVLVSVGGGTTFIALEVTTDPTFCTSCHIMEPYYESWASSSHKDVGCVECHYEPGLLETFEGKFKALSQLAKYVTATEGSKPWAEVSDQSCMRSGCHSSRLLEGEIQFGRIRFDHEHHLSSLRRGKKLRCTSCHSQLVQGEHLTVTTSSCFLCHFKDSGENGYGAPIDDCSVCHGAPEEMIVADGLQFEHSEYLTRGVECAACHGDVIRGEGRVPRERCGSCHNQQAHLDRIGEVEFMHDNHVTAHAIPCLECHTEVEHSLPPREEHYKGDCTDCHQTPHGVPSATFRGTGGEGLADDPSVMYLARVTCTGCHRPPFPGATVLTGGATYQADPVACLDCHGPGYDGMLANWQDETRGAVDALTGALTKLTESIAEAIEYEDPDADPSLAQRHHEEAAANLSRVLLDGSLGAHNLPYTRALLQRAEDEAKKGFEAVGSPRGMPSVEVGPVSASAAECTTLCHVGIESSDTAFDHARHVKREGIDCAVCHEAEPHGTRYQPAPEPTQATCVSCHHEAKRDSTCADCHGDQGALRAAEALGEPSPMWDFDCLTCHSDLKSGHSVTAMRSGCDYCHEDDEENFSALRYAPWVDEAQRPLIEWLEELDSGSGGGEISSEVLEELQRWLDAGAYHNGAWVAERVQELKGGLVTETEDG